MGGFSDKMAQAEPTSGPNVRPCFTALEKLDAHVVKLMTTTTAANGSAAGADAAQQSLLLPPDSHAARFLRDLCARPAPAPGAAVVIPLPWHVAGTAFPSELTLKAGPVALTLLPSTINLSPLFSSTHIAGYGLSLNTIEHSHLKPPLLETRSTGSAGVFLKKMNFRLGLSFN